MKRMRKQGRFPEPYSKPISYNPNSASSTDPIGSSASADYQKRLREEELLRLEQEKLVSKQIDEDKKEAEQKEPVKKGGRGRSRTPKKNKKENEKQETNEMAVDKSLKGKRSEEGSDVKKSKKPKSEPSEANNAKSAPKRQKEVVEEDKKPKKSKSQPLALENAKPASKNEDKKPKQETKTQYFAISDTVPERKKSKEKRKEEKAKEEERKETKEKDRKSTRLNSSHSSVSRMPSSA